MKNLKMLKGGTILLVIALAVGVFALVVWSDGNGTNGMGWGSIGNIESPRYGMQNKEVSNQAEGLGNEMSRRAAAPDHDGDGISNGQDEDYVSECDDECDGTCDSEPKGGGMRRNALRNENDGISEYLVHTNGRELKAMSIGELAQVWGIDSSLLLNELVKEFNLEQTYNINNTIDDLRGEYRFSPYQIMEIAERIKTVSVE